MRGARDRTSAATPKQSLDTVNHSKPDASPRSSPTPQPTGSPAAPNGTPHASADGQVNGVLADKPNDMHGDLDPDREDGRASSKRRKLSGVGASAASASASASVSAIRPISPPWKRIVVEGPTSFVEGGRRKSSRTNAVPLELQPQSDKRQTRSAQQRTPTSKSRYGGAFITPSQTPKSPSTKITRGLTRSVSMGRPPANHTAGKTLPRHPPAAADPPAKKSPAKSSSLKHRASAPTMRGASKAASRALPPRSPQRTRRSARTSDLAATRREATAPHHETPEGTDEPSSIWSSPEPEELPPNAKTPRLKFKVKMPTVPIQHPLHVVPPRLFPSFRDWLEHDDPLSGEDTRRMTNEDAEREARMRTRILDASRPGGALSEEKCAVYAIPAQEEPDRQYAHHDHLVSQVLYFRKLLGNERRLHLGAAKRLAYAAAAEWRKRQPKTEDDRLNEQYNANRAHYRLVRKSLQVKWDMIATEVARRRRERWEEEQQALGKQALNQMLEKSTHLLDARRARRSSELVSDDESGAGDLSHADASADEPEDESDKSDEGGGDDDDDDDESNMSTSEAGSEEPPGPLGVDDDEGLTVDQLRRKYARLPDTVHASIDQDDDEPELDDDTSMLFGQDSEVEITDTAAPGEDIVEAEIEEVDDALLDDSDASTDMDDDMGDSDEGGEGSSEEEDEVDDEVASEDDQAPPGLLGFFSKRELLVEEPSEKGIDDVIEDASPLAPDPSKRQVVPDASSIPTPPLGDVTSGTRGTPDEHPPPPNEDVIQHLPSRHASPGTNTTAKPSEIDASSVEMHAGSQHPSSTTTPQPSYQLKTPIPALLRGTLREYQHYGLDWLAGLYANGTNGILADEMGLGKTIQTIALLAHLACEHEVWGPHLIIVPTSVMLNWEMEFKKWCPGFKILTYYGTQEERKQKRKGWRDDDLWHVCITSYQLVLQDQQVFKRRNWHYMVLDEAHNIKNFRSQRWQTLLMFKTRARLLLTGTPLQNNLTELWSLLFFLMPTDSSENGIGGFADLKEFSDWFRRPVEQILEHGRETMDDEAKTIVTKLHKVLRPFLLRRLKADVEKQMPGKYEHVVSCRLSKRQRYLYDGFMALAQTRETLASGNYLSIINCLMQLRKVCNHPDLFETRQIVTSFAMPKAAVAEYEVRELLVRRRLLQEDPMTQVNVDFLNLVPTANEGQSHWSAEESTHLNAIRPMQDRCKKQYGRIDWRLPFDASSIEKALRQMENASRMSRLEELRHCVYLNALRSQNRPIYGHGLRERVTVHVGPASLSDLPQRRPQRSAWALNTSDVIREMVPSLAVRAQHMETTIQKFACLTPAVVAPDLTALTLTRNGVRTVLQAQARCPDDAFHEARVRLSIAFPDKRLLQYDCGKLQRLDQLLRQLQAGGHRALIFTQMTKVLDILEQFLNIHGHRYLRLDGATKIEQRQILTDRFNNDTRILAFILSSRSGGLGINLTGADTVIFYDLDWNPAMDKQCQDRCHRIGQTRDVHIYRFVSEYTIESNILRKANQKRMLDDVVIQEGEFTTDYFNNLSIRDVLGDDASAMDGDASASAAMDRVLGGGGAGGHGVGHVLEQVEDREDRVAAKLAEKEVVQADDADFDEKAGPDPAALTTSKPAAIDTSGDMLPPGSSAVPTPVTATPAPGEGDMIETSLTLDVAQSGLAAPNAMEDAVMAGDDTTIPVSTHADPDADPDDGDEDEAGHVDEYMVRFMEWNLKDVPIEPAVGKNKGKSKKKEAHRVKKR